MILHFPLLSYIVFQLYKTFIQYETFLVLIVSIYIKRRKTNENFKK